MKHTLEKKQREAVMNAREATEKLQEIDEKWHTETAALQAKLLAAERDKGKAEKKAREAGEKARDAEAKLQAAEEELLLLLRQNAEARNTSTRPQRQADTSKTQIETLQRVVEHLEALNSALRKQVDAMASPVKTIQRETDIYRQQLTQSAASREELETRYEGLSQALQDSLRMYAELKAWVVLRGQMPAREDGVVLARSQGK